MMFQSTACGETGATGHCAPRHAAVAPPRGPEHATARSMVERIASDRQRRSRLATPNLAQVCNLTCTDTWFSVSFRLNA